VLCCSSVSEAGLVVVAFEAVGCCVSMGDVAIRPFAIMFKPYNNRVGKLSVAY